MSFEVTYQKKEPQDVIVLIAPNLLLGVSVGKGLSAKDSPFGGRNLISNCSSQVLAEEVSESRRERKESGVTSPGKWPKHT